MNALWKLLSLFGIAPSETIVLNGNKIPDSTQTPTPTIKPTITPTPRPSMIARNPQVSQYNIDPQVQHAMQNAGQKYGKDNPNLLTSLLYDIAQSESGYNPNAQNPESTAGGLYQFTNPTMQTGENYAKMPGSSLQLPNNNKFDPNTAALLAAYLISNGQLGRWDASKSKWGSNYSDQELQPFYKQSGGGR